MALEMFLSVLKGIGWFFVHPLVYISVLFLFFLGYQRVKRERVHFHARVYDMIDELTSAFLPSLVAGTGLTLVTVALGFVLPFEWLVLLAAVYFLLLLTLQTRLASPAYAVSLSMFAAWILSSFTTGIAWLDQAAASFDGKLFVHAFFLLALLVLAEGLLVRIYASKKTSPRILSSKRGKFQGMHIVNRMYVLPVGLFLPYGTIGSLDWWPVFSLGGESGFSFIVVPLLVGFSQKVTSSIPSLEIERMGYRLFGFGILLAVIAAAAFFYPLAAIVGAVIALIGREAMWQLERLRDKRKPNYFNIRAHGLVILGIIPHSQAEKMMLQVGEVIVKVNGVLVNSEHSFYEALQKNSAFCKLEVMDTAGELRFAQTALYDGQHYQIGVLFTKEQVTLQDSVI